MNLRDPRRTGARYRELKYIKITGLNRRKFCLLKLEADVGGCPAATASTIPNESTGHRVVSEAPGRPETERRGAASQ